MIGYSGEPKAMQWEILLEVYHLIKKFRICKLIRQDHLSGVVDKVSDEKDDSHSRKRRLVLSPALPNLQTSTFHYRILIQVHV